MVGPVGCLTDSESPAVRLLGRGEVALSLEYVSEIVHADGDDRMIGLVDGLSNSQCTAEEYLGLWVIPPQFGDIGHPVEQIRPEMVVSSVGFGDSERVRNESGELI